MNNCGKEIDCSSFWDEVANAADLKAMQQGKDCDDGYFFKPGIAERALARFLGKEEEYLEAEKKGKGWVVLGMKVKSTDNESDPWMTFQTDEYLVSMYGLLYVNSRARIAKPLGYASKACIDKRGSTKHLKIGDRYVLESKWLTPFTVDEPVEEPVEPEPQKIQTGIGLSREDLIFLSIYKDEIAKPRTGGGSNYRQAAVTAEKKARPAIEVLVGK